MFYAVIDGRRDIDIGISLIQRPNIPVPERQYREVNIEGRGTLYEDLGYYYNIEIPLEYNFVSEDYMRTFRKVKNFFKLGKKLKFSDDLEGFYKIKRIIIQNNIREIIEFGKFTVSVICEPYFYFEDGQETIELYKGINLENIGEDTFPIFKVYGEGTLNLNVNGNTFKVNVGQAVIIDVDLELCYRESGAISNTSVKGYYKELKLIEGTNIITWNGEFDIEIIPNWRSL